MSEFRRSVTVTIDTEFGAFRPGQADGDETLDRSTVAQLLSEAGDLISEGHNFGLLRDENGATVGSFTVTETEEP